MDSAVLRNSQTRYSGLPGRMPLFIVNNVPGSSACKLRWSDSRLRNKVAGLAEISGGGFISDRPALFGAGLNDPLSDILSLIRPRALLAGLVSAEGDWAVRYAGAKWPGYCIVLQGQCLLTRREDLPLYLFRDEFVLLPRDTSFEVSSGSTAKPMVLRPAGTPGRVPHLRCGSLHDAATTELLIGSFQLDAVHRNLLDQVVPEDIHMRVDACIGPLFELTRGELSDRLPGCESMLSRLTELMLVGALRQSMFRDGPSGLLRGMRDEGLERAIKGMHARIDHPWTLCELARLASLSRTVFCGRFTRRVGMAPLAYLRSWRMHIARDLLRADGWSLSEVARRLGYCSTRTFTLAFTRHVGMSPRQYVRDALRPQLSSFSPDCGIFSRRE